jgi:hypothetical protein
MIVSSRYVEGKYYKIPLKLPFQKGEAGGIPQFIENLLISDIIHSI